MTSIGTGSLGEGGRMTRHDELRKHIEYQLMDIRILKIKIEACKNLISNFQREIDTKADYEIGEAKIMIDNDESGE